MKCSNSSSSSSFFYSFSIFLYKYLKSMFNFVILDSKYINLEKKNNYYYNKKSLLFLALRTKPISFRN